ncbi:AAA-like domain-containing protein [Microseira wollei]|uniref:TIR protein n=1 Tax=Microseira wollei NIES-4236 TaxID=2530354 RepID=A0AAV3X6L3_9CYAN|nr:AAA-like domain-containing protein [Microseira wollei]GET35984.1 TIR protein [Microseira wollei NIES-4236]
MEVEEALEFADKLIYSQTGRHLNDLERQVFVGSWEGLNYKKIYPLNPEYIEKNVGFKLWKKLSRALGEEVGKKNFRGAIERWLKDKMRKKVFICYRNQEPDLSLALKFYQGIEEGGARAFIVTLDFNTPTAVSPAGWEGLGNRGGDWLGRIDAELKQCDYFLLFLSPEVAVSEMAIEMLRWVKELHSSRNKPVLLPIRVNCPQSVPLNHDLRCYLDGIGQREWKSPADTPILLQAVLNLLRGSENKTWEDEDNCSVSSPHPVAPSLPLPVAEPELPSGQVRLASAFYVERVPSEVQCYREILQPGALIRIKAPRQMGKTSLMARILYHAKEEQGYRTVPLSFQHADTAVFTNLTQLLRWFCGKISRKLRLTHQIDDYWSDTYGSKDNCTAYFEDCLLSNSDKPLVLGLDEVDRVFQYPKIADDFFGLLRAWYEEAGYGDKDSNLWEKLRLVVVHSTEVYVPMNVNQSPFNVGLPIELPEFSLEQVLDLTERHRLNWNATQIEQLMALVGGHPYLLRFGLYNIAQQQITLEKLLQTAVTEAGLYNDHLRRHLWTLKQYPDLADAFAKVVRANAPVELESLEAFKLHSMGLVKFEGNQVIPRFDLYRIYFRDRLSSS